MTEGTENRRREERFSVNTVITINEQPAMVKDISPGGMRVTAMNLKPQQLIDLSYQSGEKDISMKGMVRWVKRAYPFETYSECGLALVSVPGVYHDLYEELTVSPRFLPLFGFWPVSFVLFSLAVALLLWI